MQGSLTVSLALIKSMIRALSIFIAFAFISFNKSYGQSTPYCGSDQYEEILLSDPIYKSQLKKEEKRYRSYIQNTKNQKRNNEIFIPVVFHIIHNNGLENISDTLVYQGLEHLNQAFENTGPFLNELGIDTKIRFCLAQRDETNNEFSGILRHESQFTDMSIFSGFEFVMSKRLDSSKYVNIQIVKNACLGTSCNISGFAGQDRLVVQANTLNGTSNDATVLVHEMGHFLGLYHTWYKGCQNDNCLEDGDKVCDTPPDNRTFDGCDAPANSCSTDANDISTNNPFRPVALGGQGDQNDDHINIMDYNIRPCRNKFTQGQADRMHFITQQRYKSNLASKACLPPCEEEVVADFQLPDSIPVGSSLTIINQSIMAEDYMWYIDNTLISTEENLNYTFSEIDLVQVQLEAFTSDTLCESKIAIKSIRVYCPVEACFDYQIQDQYLYLEGCTVGSTGQFYTIIADGDSLHFSTLNVDSIYINNIDFVEVCLTASGEYCDDFNCEYITISADGSEVCGNDEDDDGDGLIDLFDPDCECDESAYQAQCPTDCQIIPDSFPSIALSMKWQTEVLGNSTSNIVVGENVNNQGVSILTTKTVQTNVFSEEVFIVDINGEDGSINLETRVDEDQRGQVAIGRTELNNVNVFYSSFDHYSKFSNFTGSSDDSESVSNPSYGSLHLADMNGDGTVEVIKGTSVFNSITGRLLIDGPLEGGCNFGIPCVSSVVAIADLTSSPGLELAAGNTVFEIDINNTDNQAGNISTPILADAQVNDGFTSIGDINGDNALDVIVVRSNAFSDGGGIFVWDPRSTSLIAKAEAGEAGGIAFIGDVDNDCIPEIGVAFKHELRLYKYDNTQNLQIMWQVVTSDNSGRTGATMFDFNQDGKLEIIYRDETSLKIFDGISGTVLSSFPLGSITGRESPIVADVDNDGQAEILVAGYDNIEGESRLYCFETATMPWAPARSVWNQYTYNPTQVNDDLTIPRNPQNFAQPLQGIEQCPRETCATPYNNFMVQATYRTQEGCYVWPELQRDLSVSATSKCIGDSIEICLYANSNDAFIFQEGVSISCYVPSLGNDTYPLLDTITIISDTTCMMIPKVPGIDTLLILINDEGETYPPDFPNTDIAECDYTNNEYILHLGGPDFQIEIIGYDCSPDSLTFYIATDNIGMETDIDCIGGGCYFADPTPAILAGEIPNLVEFTNWCFEYNSTTMTFQYQDTFKVTIPHPNGQSQIWWVINEGGFGPGLLSSQVTGIFECNYENNIDGTSFDIFEKDLDLGPDIIKCETEVFTLTADSDFESYLWNDLSTDSIYSAIEDGIHYVAATDQCGRVYRDTVTIIIDDSEDINLGADFTLCYEQDTILTIVGDFEQVFWSPSEIVDCDTCLMTSISVDSFSSIFVRARNGNCISYDTIEINRILPEIDTTKMSYCDGDTITFYGQFIYTTGIYENFSSNCTQLEILDVIFVAPDTVTIEEQICASDSIFFDGQYVIEEGLYYVNSQNELGCDSTFILQLETVNEITRHDTIDICQNDSIQVFGEWIFRDTVLQQTYMSSSGCDSIQAVLVAVAELAENILSLNLCEGDSIYLYDNWYKEEGTYDLIVLNFEDCDSIIYLEIISLESYTTYDTIIACVGDTIDIQGELFTETDNIQEILSAYNGCDSVSNTFLNFVDTLKSTEEVILCPGDSVLINGEWVKAKGQFETIHKSILGCDSIHYINVNYVAEPPIPETDVDCESLEIILSIDSQSEWSPTWSNGDTSYQTISSNGSMEATLKLFTFPNCEKQITITLPTLPNENDLPSFEDTTLQKYQILTIDLGLDPNAWTVLWNISTLVNCDTCMNVEIAPIEDTEVNLYLEHESGCFYESTFNIKIQEQEEGVFIPNVFSPNGENNNDEWVIFSSENILIQECSVFDRWGNLMYYSTNQQPKWDGRLNGELCQQGVYMYIISFINFEGNKQISYGDITLLR